MTKMPRITKLLTINKGQYPVIKGKIYYYSIVYRNLETEELYLKKIKDGKLRRFPEWALAQMFGIKKEKFLEILNKAVEAQSNEATSNSSNNTHNDGDTECSVEPKEEEVIEGSESEQEDSGNP